MFIWINLGDSNTRFALEIESVLHFDPYDPNAGLLWIYFKFKEIIWGASKTQAFHLNVILIFHQFGTFLCKMLAYCDTLSVVCSVLNLTGLSVERWLFSSFLSNMRQLYRIKTWPVENCTPRYYAVVHPMKAHYLCTTSQVIWMLQNSAIPEADCPFLLNWTIVHLFTYSTGKEGDKGALATCCNPLSTNCVCKGQHGGLDIFHYHHKYHHCHCCHFCSSLSLLSSSSLFKLLLSINARVNKEVSILCHYHYCHFL